MKNFKKCLGTNLNFREAYRKQLDRLWVSQLSRVKSNWGSFPKWTMFVLLFVAWLRGLLRFVCRAVGHWFACGYLKSYLAVQRYMKMANYDSSASSSSWKKLYMCWSLIRLSTSCSATFWQPLVFRATFFCFEQLFALWAISSFPPILRYWSSFQCLNWPYFHISQCFSWRFMHFLWKRSQILPLGQIMDARCMLPGC